MIRNFIVTLDYYEKIRKIGEGHFSCVYLIKDRETNQEYATKINRKMISDEIEQRNFMSEIEIYSKIKHPAILGFVGYNLFNFESEPYPVSIFDYVPNGSLESYIFKVKNGNKRWTDTNKYIIILGISFGMRYLHSQNISHRDLKPANILLDEKLYPKICDFGLSKITNDLDSYMDSYLGTPFYMAPEIKRGKPFTSKVDVYAFSIIVSEILANKRTKFSTDNIIGKENKAFLGKCNSPNSSLRPSFEEICQYFVTKNFLSNFKDIDINEVSSFFDWLEQGDPSISFYRYKLFRENWPSQNPETFDISKDDIPIQITQNSIVYNIYKKKSVAHIHESPNVQGDVIIPSTIQYYPKEYDVTLICDNAFSNSSIDSLKFASESKVKFIGNLAFASSPLFRLQIPASLEILADNWCQGADQLRQVEVSPNNRHFSIETFFLIEKKENSKEILLSLKQIKGELIVPPDITCIRSFAFANQASLTSVVSESSVLREIGHNAFHNCESLFSVTLKKSKNLAVGSFCFFECKKLSVVNFFCDEVLIGRSCFENCASLQTLLFHKIASLEIGSHAINGCDSLPAIAVNEADRIVIDAESFFGASKLKSIGLFGGMILLGDDFVRNCGALSLVSINSKENLTIKSATFECCKFLNEVRISTTSELTFECSCFNGLLNMKTFEASGEKVTFGDGCFNDCSSLTEFVVTNSGDVSLGKSQFNWCIKLSKIQIESTQSVELNDDSFCGAANLSEVKISCEGDVKMSDNFFKGFSMLKTVFLKLKNLTIPSGFFENCESIEKVVIEGNSIVELCQKVFAGKANLNSIEINGCNVLIGKYCFLECPSLHSFVVKTARSITMSSHLFKGCRKLLHIDLGVSDVLSVCNNAFEASFVQNVSLQGSTVHIGEESFKNCVNLSSFSVPSACELHIDERSFEGCYKITEVLLNASSKLDIGPSCFAAISCLKSLSLQGIDVRIGKFCFSNCTALRSVYLESADCVLLDDGSFKDCKNIETVTVNSKAECRMGDECFARDRKLKSLKLEGKVMMIGDRCFECCSSLAYVSILMANEIYYYKNSFKKVANSIVYDFSNNAKVTINDE